MAKLFFQNETFRVHDNVTIIGSGSTTEGVLIIGSPQVEMDANIERIDLGKNIGDYTFIVIGTTIKIYDGIIPVAVFSILNQDVTVKFGDGSATLSLRGLNIATLGGTFLPTDNKVHIVPSVVDETDISDTAEGGSEIIIDPAPEDTSIDNATLFSTAQSKSATISGIDQDTLVSLDNYIVAALYEGDSWLNFQNASDPVTYSFNETLPLEYYDSGDTTGWKTVASHVRDVIDAVVSTTDGMILPDIEKIFSGQIRFNMIQPEEGVAAYAYYPNSLAIVPYKRTPTL